MAYFVTPRTGTPAKEIPTGCSIQQDTCDQLRAIERAPIQINIPELAGCTPGTQQGDCYPTNNVETSGWQQAVAYTTALFLGDIPLTAFSAGQSWPLQVEFKADPCTPCSVHQLPLTGGHVSIDSTLPIADYKFPPNTLDRIEPITIPASTLQNLTHGQIHYLVIENEAQNPLDALGFRNSTNYGVLFVPFVVS